MKWEEWHVKMAFGFVVLIFLFILAVMAAREGAALQGISNSDLAAVLAVLAVIVGAWAQWAFNRKEGG